MIGFGGNHDVLYGGDNDDDDQDDNDDNDDVDEDDNDDDDANLLFKPVCKPPCRGPV